MRLEDLIRWHTEGVALAFCESRAARAIDQGDHDAHMRWGRAFHAGRPLTEADRANMATTEARIFG